MSNPLRRQRQKKTLYTADLFSMTDPNADAFEPLADRMRPRSFAEFFGQDHIIGEGKLLRRAIEADQISSVILSGPPGTGKTTIANIIAYLTNGEFVTLNAVLDGVKELRDVIVAAEARPLSKKTILFVDEIHRWNKAQQDALLPHVEAGTIILIGATTENPYFSLVAPLLSRSRVFRLEPLTIAQITNVMGRALKDSERGYGKRTIKLAPDALNHLADVANGDARSALNALELAVMTTKPNAEGEIVIDLQIAEESIQRRSIRYDRDEDEHYDTISAFIKSLRGSDPDAALYWLAKMINAGEDPRVLFRRMLILACEDVGLADPQAIVVVNAAADSFERVGMPEGNYLLSMACLYLATAPKSNTASAIFPALSYLEKHGPGLVPDHLRDSTAAAMRSRAEGTSNPSTAYVNPHSQPAAWVAQQYLPEGFKRPNWYKAKAVGYEKSIAERMQGYAFPDAPAKPPAKAESPKAEKKAPSAESATEERAKKDAAKPE